MTIYYDPTECREGSRLPDSVCSQGKALPGLEEATGADLLVTTLAEPLDDVRGCAAVPDAAMIMPMRLRSQRLGAACDAGLLVQRKSGRDLTGSIPVLSDILFRMLAWTSRPWLLAVCDVKSDAKGQAIVDGQETGFSHNALQGALEAWQLRGGYVTILSRDTLIAPWLSRQLDRLRKPDDDVKTLAPRPVQQSVVGDDKPWRAMFTALPGCGAEIAGRLADECGSPACVLERISDPSWLQPKGARPNGVGTLTVRKWREYLGLTEDWLRIVVAAEAMPEGWEKIFYVKGE